MNENRCDGRSLLKLKLKTPPTCQDFSSTITVYRIGRYCYWSLVANVKQPVLSKTLNYLVRRRPLFSSLERPTGSINGTIWKGWSGCRDESEVSRPSDYCFKKLMVLDTTENYLWRGGSDGSSHLSIWKGWSDKQGWEPDTSSGDYCLSLFVF